MRLVTRLCRGLSLIFSLRAVCCALCFLLCHQDPTSDAYSGFDAPGCDQGLLTQHQNEMMMSADAVPMGAFGAQQPMSHLSSSYSEDDLAQAADVVTADLDAVLMGGHSTPPPAPLLAPGAQLAAQQRFYLKQDHSGAAGSSCGASSPQASCDTQQQAKAAQHQQLWAAQQQQHYDPCYSLAMEQYVAAPLMHGAFGLSGPCCAYPGASSLPPQGSGSMTGPAQYDSYAYYLQEPSPAAGGFGLGSAAGPVGCTGMVPHAAFGSNGMMTRNNSAPPAGLPSVYAPASLQRAYGTYPPIQGGVQKRQSGTGAAASTGAKAASTAAEGRAARRSADGSCSSKGGSPAPLPRGNKAGSKARAATAAAGSGSTGRGSRGSASAAAPAAAAVAASGSAASLIKELQQEVRLCVRHALPACVLLRVWPAAPSGNLPSHVGRTACADAAEDCAADALTCADPTLPRLSASRLCSGLPLSQIESLTASKAQLKTQVKTLLTSQTDLLSRVATLTTKWQQAVAENASLHRQNLQLASQGL